MSDDRWSRTAARLAELEERRRPAFTEAVRAFLQPRGDERAIDVGTGTGALAFALSPFVAEVVADRGVLPTLKAMKRGKTLYGQNPADIKRLATKQARRRRLRRA